MLKLLTNLIILIYGLYLPIFWSHKALEEGNIEDLKKWLTHWITYVLFRQALCATDSVFRSWLPFYNIIVLTTFLWFINPQFNGGRYFYENHLKVFLSKHEQTIVSFNKSIGRCLFKFTIKAGYEVAEYLKNGLIWILRKYSRELSDVCSQLNRILLKKDNSERPVADFGEKRSDGLLAEYKNCLQNKGDSSSEESKPRTDMLLVEDKNSAKDLLKNETKPRTDELFEESQNRLVSGDDSQNNFSKPRADELFEEGQNSLGHGDNSQNNWSHSSFPEMLEEGQNSSVLKDHPRPKRAKPRRDSSLKKCVSQSLMFHNEYLKLDAAGRSKNEVGAKCCLKSSKTNKKTMPKKCVYKNMTLKD